MATKCEWHLLSLEADLYVVDLNTYDRQPFIRGSSIPTKFVLTATQHAYNQYAIEPLMGDERNFQVMWCNNYGLIPYLETLRTLLGVDNTTEILLSL